ncbi:MAG: hypothetical protein EOM90_01285 [Alphaproteobacteria bacterium]|nr:hypothetical protein [Alphaproteobacteria bacterium]
MFYKSVLLIFAAGIGLPFVSLAIGERNPAGALAGAMGGVSVSVSDIWSASNNPAGTAWLKGVSAGIFFENRFMMKELMYQQGVVVLAVKPGSFAINLSHFGALGYLEFRSGLSYSRKFGKMFSAGIRLEYLRLGLPDDYGSKNLLSSAIGLQFRPTDRILAGILIANPVPVRTASQPVEYLPTVFCAGVSYRFSENFLAVLEAEKDLIEPMVIRMGAEYQIAGRLFIRAGLATNPWVVTFGFGLKLGKLTIDLASGFHQALGFSPGGSVIFQNTNESGNKRKTGASHRSGL